MKNAIIMAVSLAVSLLAVISVIFASGMYVGSLLTIYNAKPEIVSENIIDIDYGYRVDSYIIE